MSQETIIETFFTVSEERDILKKIMSYKDDIMEERDNLKLENFKLQEELDKSQLNFNEACNLLRQARNILSEERCLHEVEQDISIFLNKYGFENIE